MTQSVETEAAPAISKKEVLALVQDENKTDDFLKKTVHPVIAPSDLQIETTDQMITFFGLRDGSPDYNGILDDPDMKAILTKGVVSSDPCSQNGAKLLDLGTILNLRLDPNEIYTLTLCSPKVPASYGQQIVRKNIATKLISTMAGKPEIESLALLPPDSNLPAMQYRKAKLTVKTFENPPHTEYLFVIRSSDKGSGIYHFESDEALFDEDPELVADIYWESPSDKPEPKVLYNKEKKEITAELILEPGHEFHITVKARNNARFVTELSEEASITTPSISDALASIESGTNSGDSASDSEATNKTTGVSKDQTVDKKDLDQQIADAQAKLKEARKELRNARKEVVKLNHRDLIKDFQSSKESMVALYKTGKIDKKDYKKELKKLRGELSEKKKGVNLARKDARKELKTHQKIVKAISTEVKSLKKQKRLEQRKLYKELKKKRKAQKQL